MNREEGLTIVHQYVENLALRRHMLAVEAAMRDYAIHLGHDPDPWGLTGLLHDFDWEIHPDLERHPQEGAPILRRHGVPEEIVICILSHANHSGIPRLSPMQKALFACDELTGLITAVSLVRPSQSIHEVAVKSIRKKFGEARFAAAVNREEIVQGAQEFEIDLWEHAANVLASMQKIAPALGLAGRP